MASETEDRIEKLDRLLTEYVEEKLLLKHLHVPDINLDITKDELMHMPVEDIHGYRLELSKYITYLQKEINTHQSRAKWAAGALRVYLGSKAADFAGFTFEEKKMNAYKHDEYAKKLNKLALESEACLDRIKFLPDKFEVTLGVAKDIAWARRNQDVGNN